MTEPPMSQRKLAVPAWRQVAGALKSQILKGERRSGDCLPSEAELVALFGVSRHAVRQAISALETCGLLRIDGRAVFVEPTPRLSYAISTRTRRSRNLIEQGVEPGAVLLSEEIVAADGEVAEALGLPPGEPVFRGCGLGTADGIPIELIEGFVPVQRFPDFSRVRKTSRTMSATLKAYGIFDYQRVRTEIAARMPTAEEARLLRQAPTTPVFVVTKVDADMDGRPIVFGTSVWCSERVSFNIVLNASA